MSANRRINRKGLVFLSYEHNKNIENNGFKFNKKLEFTAYSIVSMFMDILGVLTATRLILFYLCMTIKKIF